MKYIGELSLAWLVIVVFYAVTVDARSLDPDTYITDRDDNSPNENDGNDIDENLTITADELYNIVEMALGSYMNSRQDPSKSLWRPPMDNYKRSLSNSAYARAALKRNMRDGLRNELAKKSYHSPIDMSGGGLMGHGLITGLGR